MFSLLLHTSFIGLLTIVSTLNITHTLYMTNLSRITVSAGNIKRTVLTFLLLLTVSFAMASGRSYRFRVMSRVFRYASTVDTSRLRSVNTRAYLKYDIRINRRNAILLAIPTMFAVANGGDREYIGETYDRITIGKNGEIKAKRLLDRSTVPHQMNTMPTLFKYLTPRPYEEMLIEGRVLSPFHFRNRRFYRYQVTPFSVNEALVSFRPRTNNTQMVRGWARVDVHTGRILEGAFDGEYDMIRFHIAVTMGTKGAWSVLPSECSLNSRFLFLGNDITSEYTLAIGLPKVIGDTIVNRRDTALINRVRPIPLTSHEEYLYHKYYAARNKGNDTLRSDGKEQKKTFSHRFWGAVGRGLVDKMKQDFGSKGQGSVRVAPILNPLYFSYSSRRGFTYKFDIRGSYYFNDHQALQLRFKAGYAFKEKQFFFNLPFTFYLDRKHDAYIRTEWDSGRRMTSSEVVDAIKKERADSIDWDALNLTYFRSHYLKVFAHYDPTPQWGLETGIITRKRRAIFTDGFSQADKPSHYTSVAPLLELTYRPTGYNGPVFTLDYERSFRGLMGSNTAYERMEIDGQYIHRLSALSSLQMRAGAGFYTHKGPDSYFLDYTNFRENNVPGGWNDDWACSFELLNSNWYNASEYYVRANIAYESPLMLLSRLPLCGRLIEKERIYFNALAVRNLNPYIEWGYGFRTRAISVGAFVSQHKWDFKEATIRIGIELFRHW